MTTDTPLIVFVHEAGSPRAIEGLIVRLPTTVEYAVMPAPQTADELRGKLDGLASGERPVILLGHGEAVPVVGAVVLADPARFAGAGFINGAFDLDGVQGTALSGLPVFHALGEKDLDIPLRDQSATWRWLTSESGAPVTAHLDSGGHGPTDGTVEELAKWIDHRATRIAEVGIASIGLSDPVEWSFGELPIHNGGARPLVTWSVPQQQYSDQAMIPFQDQLFEKVSALPGVKVGQSEIAVPGARALVTEGGMTGDPTHYLDATTGEFAHLHPWYDGSLHVVLSPAQVGDLVAKGWGQPHMWAGTRYTEGFVLVYGPRSEAEVEILAGIVEAGLAYTSS